KAVLDIGDEETLREEIQQTFFAESSDAAMGGNSNTRTVHLPPHTPFQLFYKNPIEINFSGKDVLLISYADLLKTNPTLAEKFTYHIGYFLIDPTDPKAFKGVRHHELVDFGPETLHRFHWPKENYRPHLRIVRTDHTF